MSATASIAVLHTSLLFVNADSVINDCLAELAPDAKVLHFLDSDVLATVMRDGEVSPASTQRIVHLAQAAQCAGADVIGIPPWILRPSGRRGNGLLRSRAGKEDSPPGRVVVHHQLPAENHKLMC